MKIEINENNVNLTLRVADRVYTMQLLPTSSTYEGMMIVKSLIDKFRFNEEDTKKAGIKIDDKNNVSWSNEFDSSIEITKQEFDFIKTSARKFSEGNNVTLSNLDTIGAILEQGK
jgi:hypothetical protein